MKSTARYIYPFEENNFFKPIREKADYAKVVILAARKLLIDEIHISDEESDLQRDEEIGSPSVKLVIDKMSRLFFFKEDRYFSIAFPFLTQIENNNVLSIQTYTGKDVDNKAISAVISILEDDHFKLNPSLIDFYIEPSGIESDGLFLLEELFRAEPAYVRYDYDPDNEDGKRHPLHHLDVNYSQYGTFKLGMNDKIEQLYFENLHNIKTDCSFLI